MPGGTPVESLLCLEGHVLLLLVPRLLQWGSQFADEGRRHPRSVEDNDPPELPEHEQKKEQEELEHLTRALSQQKFPGPKLSALVPVATLNLKRTYVNVCIYFLVLSSTAVLKISGK